MCFVMQVHIVGSAGLPEDLKPLIVDNARHVVFHDWLSDADLLALYGKVGLRVLLSILLELSLPPRG